MSIGGGTSRVKCNKFNIRMSPGTISLLIAVLSTSVEGSGPSFPAAPPVLVTPLNIGLLESSDSKSIVFAIVTRNLLKPSLKVLAASSCLLNRQLFIDAWRRKSSVAVSSHAVVVLSSSSETWLMKSRNSSSSTAKKRFHVTIKIWVKYVVLSLL